MDNLILSTSEALSYLTTTVVHPTYFPYLWAPTLHAARISLVYQTLSRRSGNASWGSYIAGYLVACWAGGALTHFLLGLRPALTYSFNPYINYVGVHMVLTAVFTLFPALLVPKYFDTLLFPLDGLSRALAVTNAVSLLNNPNISASARPLNSAFGVLVLGALASSSGGIAMSTFSLFSPEWKFSTPPILKAGLWTSADVWGGALAALVYGAATHNPAFSIPGLSYELAHGYYPLNLVPASILQFFFKPSSTFFGKQPSFHFLTSAPLPASSAQALSALTLVVVFGSRVLVTHWLSQSKPQSKPSLAQKGMKEAKQKKH